MIWPGNKQWQPPGVAWLVWAHLGVEHIDAEVAESSLEEVVFGAVLEEGTVHGTGPYL